MVVSANYWYFFFALVLGAISIDLVMATRSSKNMSYTSSLYMTLFWFLLALAFAAFIAFELTYHDATLFLTGYLVELSLSIDNIFVFILIFNQFKMSQHAQHKILMIGIFSAIIMRLIMITAGIYLIQKFEWLFYIFGALLIYGGIHIVLNADKKEKEGDATGLLNKLGRYIPITSENLHDNFVVKKNGKYYLTHMFIVLLLIEKADLVFALDSIPAVLSITDNTFIVFTSNIFAILGLRSMYFFLSHVLQKFQYIKYALSFILCYIGVKMIMNIYGFHIPVLISLSVIITAVGVSIIFSLMKSRHHDQA